jgi:hypothetical protein
MAESKEFIKLLDDIRDLHKRKNDGYAGKDADDPWANFRMAEMLGISAFQGCLIRMSDKFIRVCNLSKDPTNDQVGEHITDTLLDLAVYSLIAICLYNEKPREDPLDIPALYETNRLLKESAILELFKEIEEFKKDTSEPVSLKDQNNKVAYNFTTSVDIDRANAAFKQAMEDFTKKEQNIIDPVKLDSLTYLDEALRKIDEYKNNENDSLLKIQIRASELENLTLVEVMDLRNQLIRELSDFINNEYELRTQPKIMETEEFAAKPTNSGLTDEEMDRLIYYLKSLKKDGVFDFGEVMEKIHGSSD